MPTPIFFTIACLLLYAASALSLSRSGDYSSREIRSKVLVPGTLGVLFHLLVAQHKISGGAATDFGLFNAITLISAIITLLILGLSLRYRVHYLLMGAYPINLLALLATTLLDPLNPSIPSADTGIKIHMGLSLLSFCILTLAVFEALLLLIENHLVRSRFNSPLLRRLPPLLSLESLLFKTIWAGVILLTAGIISGIIFLDDPLAQQLWHKTVFSILAWCTFALLLAGRHRLGWRGTQAASLTLGGGFLLALSYLGSKLVLEIILQSAGP